MPGKAAQPLSPSTRDRWRLRCSYLDCLGEEEQRNHDLALNGIFLETIDTYGSIDGNYSCLRRITRQFSLNPPALHLGFPSTESSGFGGGGA